MKVSRRDLEERGARAKAADTPAHMLSQSSAHFRLSPGKPSVRGSLFLSRFSFPSGGCVRRTTSASGVVLAGRSSCGCEVGRFCEPRGCRCGRSVWFPVRSELKPPTGCSQAARLGCKASFPTAGEVLRGVRGCPTLRSWGGEGIFQQVT